MARKPDPPPRESRVTVPARCHPIAKIVFAEMKRQGVTYWELEQRSGVLAATFKAWRSHSRPGLDSAEAALGSLGWAVIAVPRMQELPPKIQAGLEALSAEWQSENPLLHQLLATVSRIPILGEFKRQADAAVVALPKRRKARALHPDQILLIEAPTEQAA